MNGNFLPVCFCLLLLCLHACKDNQTRRSEINTQDSGYDVKAVLINGDSLHYIDVGKGDPVIFVHGTLGDFRSFSGQIDTFSKYHRVIVYSRRYAFPDTGNIPTEYTISSHVKDLSQFIKLLNIQPAHVVGHSFGARIALQTAIDNPELVSSLTLGEPPVPSLLKNAAGGDTILRNFNAKTVNPAAKAFREGNREKALTIFIGGVMGDSMFYSRIPQEDRERMATNIRELRGIALTNDPYLPLQCDDLKKIKAPALLLEGEKSPAFFTLVIKELNRCLPNSELIKLPNASHGLQDQNPAEFNKIVLGFVDKH